MTNNTRTWSQQQLDIFEHFATGKGNLVVRARAGTGKTTTIIEAVAHAPASEKILLAAFNKKIATELTARVTAPNCDAKTLHGLGFAYIRRQWSNVKVDQAVDYNRAAFVCGPKAPDEMIKLVVKLASLLKACAPLTTDTETAIGIAESFDVVPDETWEEEGWDTATVASYAIRARDAAKERDEDGRISFDDMIFIPVACGFAKPWYTLVVIDEAQDMNASQLMLAQAACKKTGRIVVVGDEHQCHPPGVQVAISPTESTPIEKLSNSDTVMSWNRNAQKMVAGRKIKIASRRYTGTIRNIASNGRIVPATNNHKFIARWTNRAVKTCVTYLMWREGFGFRVGWCQLFGKSKMFHLAHRARIEKADKTWILAVHTSRTEASVYESIVAGRYALPTATFEPVHGAQHLTKKTLRQIFDGVSSTAVGGTNLENGTQALLDHARDPAFPLYPWPGHKLGDMQGRRTYFEVHACNLMPDLMSLPAPDSQNEWHPIDAVVCKPYNGLVYSMDVEKDHSYSANGIVVLNCIYGFRGADADGIDRLKSELNARELGLKTTYRCAKNIVAVAQTYVPDFESGSVYLGTVDSITDGSEKFYKAAQPGDFVLSRKNAPLMTICLGFLRRGVKARIEGRDVAAGLRAIVKSVKAKSIPDFIAKVGTWAKKSIARANKLTHEGARTGKIAQIEDQRDMLIALVEGCASVDEAMNRIDTLFGETEPGVTSNAVVCSSVHRAKGLEADRVFVLQSTIKDSSREERNIAYVAISRARNHLTWLTQE